MTFNAGGWWRRICSDRVRPESWTEIVTFKIGREVHADVQIGIVQSERWNSGQCDLVRYFYRFDRGCPFDSLYHYEDFREVEKCPSSILVFARRVRGKFHGFLGWHRSPGSKVPLCNFSYDGIIVRYTFLSITKGGVFKSSRIPPFRSLTVLQKPLLH